jgi:hypothetical protein
MAHRSSFESNVQEALYFLLYKGRISGVAFAFERRRLITSAHVFEGTDNGAHIDWGLAHPSDLEVVIPLRSAPLLSSTGAREPDVAVIECSGDYSLRFYHWFGTPLFVGEKLWVHTLGFNGTRRLENGSGKVEHIIRDVTYRGRTSYIRTGMANEHFAEGFRPRVGHSGGVVVSERTEAVCGVLVGASGEEHKEICLFSDISAVVNSIDSSGDECGPPLRDPGAILRPWYRARGLWWTSYFLLCLAISGMWVLLPFFVGPFGIGGKVALPFALVSLGLLVFSQPFIARCFELSHAFRTRDVTTAVTLAFTSASVELLRVVVLGSRALPDQVSSLQWTPWFWIRALRFSVLANMFAVAPTLATWVLVSYQHGVSLRQAFGYVLFIGPLWAMSTIMTATSMTVTFRLLLRLAKRRYVSFRVVVGHVFVDVAVLLTCSAVAFFANTTATSWTFYAGRWLAWPEVVLQLVNHAYFVHGVDINTLLTRAWWSVTLVSAMIAAITSGLPSLVYLAAMFCVVVARLRDERLRSTYFPLRYDLGIFNPLWSIIGMVLLLIILLASDGSGGWRLDEFHDVSDLDGKVLPAGSYVVDSVTMPECTDIPSGELLANRPHCLARVALGLGLPPTPLATDVSVYLERDLWVGREEISQGRWYSVVSDPRFHEWGLPHYPSIYRNPAYPVESISLCEAMRFANAMSIRDDYEPAYLDQDGNPALEGCEGTDELPVAQEVGGYRLPTLAEWLVVSHELESHPNPPWNADRSFMRATTTSCTASQKDLQICHLLGNVREWVLVSDYDQLIAPQVTRAKNSEAWVCGGAWDFALPWTRRNACQKRPPGSLDSDLGFRLVRWAPSDEQPR